MKTTLELPDELLIAAKKRAVELRQSLRALVTSGLRRELGAGASQQSRAAHRRLKWVTVEGGLPPNLDVTRRQDMHEWLAQQRGKPVAR